MNYYNFENIIKNMKKNKWLLLVVTLFFIMGLAIGSVVVKVLDLNEKKNLVVYLNKFFLIINDEKIRNIDIFYKSFRNNFQTVFLVWLLSITVVGVPVTLFAITFRGFILGFSVAFFIEGMGWKGLLVTVLAILPQNIIYIPCLICISALSLKFSISILMRNIKNGVAFQYKNSMFTYTIIIIILFLVMNLGAVIEATLSPILLKAISSYIMVS